MNEMKKYFALLLVVGSLPGIGPCVQTDEAGDVGSSACRIVQLDAQDAVELGAPYRNHGQMVRTAASVVNEAEDAGEITEECASCIVSQFARRIPIADQEACGSDVSPSDMAQIPAGCFDMGDHFGEGEIDEMLVHNVCISDYEMDMHEVTNAGYAECVADSACSYLTGTSQPACKQFYDPFYSDYPVVCVSRDDADDYCSWAGKRLPTEAEWEYAARGGLWGKRYPWGDPISDSYAQFSSFGRNPVGSYPANGYGLYDMAGNVWEWVNDWYQVDYYSVSPANDPPGPASGSFGISRGGVNGSAYTMRVSDRLSNVPVAFAVVGFRCARGGAYGP